MNLNQEEFNQINKIMALSVLINEKTEYCVFISFSGHVDSLQIKIKRSKKNWEEEVASSFIYINKDNWNGLSKLERLDQIIETLEQFLIQESVPYDFLEKVERIEYDYKF